MTSRIEAPKLKSSSITFAALNAKKVMARESWRVVEAEYPKIITEISLTLADLQI